MKARSAKEIKEKIAELREERNNIREFSLFGDNNWKILDLMIEVLEGKIDDEDELWDQKEELMEQGVDESSLSDIINIINWLNGEKIL